jgi:hypothetical protein
MAPRRPLPWGRRARLAARRAAHLARQGAIRTQQAVGQQAERFRKAGRIVAVKVIQLQRMAGLNAKLMQRSAASVLYREKGPQPDPAWLTGYRDVVRAELTGVVSPEPRHAPAVPRRPAPTRRPPAARRGPERPSEPPAGVPEPELRQAAAEPPDSDREPELPTAPEPIEQGAEPSDAWHAEEPDDLPEAPPQPDPLDAWRDWEPEPEEPGQETAELEPADMEAGE